MAHLDLFGHSHQFHMEEESPQSCESIVSFIQTLAVDIPVLQHKERSYLLLLIKVVQLYLSQKAHCDQLEEQVDQLNGLCLKIEEALEHSQSVFEPAI